MKKKHILGLFAFVAMVTGFIYFGSNVSAQKSDVPNKSPQAAPLNSTPQTLPFSQDWTINLITANDDWAPVPGIVGFLGDDASTTATNVDPRTLLAPIGAVDVIANQANPDTLTSGGVAEFDTLANPAVALNGSGTADVPHIILYLNTTGQNNIRVQYNARDLDASADNSVQQINTQYRVGSSGNFINVPGGYIADASGGPSTATLVTPVDVTLPAAASNQPEVQVRIMTTNAAGNDEWIGIDNILVNTAANPAPNRANVDFNGDGRSDYVVLRDVSGQLVWYVMENGSGAISGAAWGLAASDRQTPADFDGDGRTDIAVWREAPATQAAFYILRSSNGTVGISVFGQTGDDPSVVGDYDGDGKADPATYRCPTTPGQCTWFFRGSLNNPAGNITYVPWGFGAAPLPLSQSDGLKSDLNGPPPPTQPAAGDYDGDGKFDFCVRNGGQGVFVLLRSSDLGIEWINWGLATDLIVPRSDFDGDGRTDHAVARPGTFNFELYILERDGGGTGAGPILFGSPAADDDGAFGDYDGDGRQDIGIWRSNPDPAQNYFWIRQSSNGFVFLVEWGQQGDRTAAAWIFPRE